jgi:ABC-type Fe3+-siderophore transport system permease subunit
MDHLALRMFCSFLSGVLLSKTGSFIQLSTRNILASPSTLGFDGLAILWVMIFHSLSLYLHWNINYSGWMLLLGGPGMVFIGLVFVRMMKGQKAFERPILLGLTFNLLVGAIFSLWQFLFLAFNLPFPSELWFGHFRFASSEALIILISSEALFLLGLKIFWRELNLYSLGSGIARNWSLDEKKLFRFLFVSVSLGTLVVVSLFGAFSFLGLIFPIVARKLWFHSRGLSGEFIWGSVFNGVGLMLIDLVCYSFPLYGAEVPVGLVVVAIGALSLMLLLWKSHNASEILAKQTK